MVRSWSLLWDHSCRACFKFAVFNYSETDTAPIEVSVVGSYSSANWCGIIRIGEVACLCSFNFFYIFDWHGISAIRCAWKSGFFAVMAPQIGLTNVVIVWDRDCGAVSNYFSKVSAKLQPCGVMAAVIVDLISREE